MTSEELKEAGFLYIKLDGLDAFYYFGEKIKIEIAFEHEGFWDVNICCSDSNIISKWNKKWKMGEKELTRWEWICDIDRLKEILLKYNIRLPLLIHPTDFFLHPITNREN